MQGCGGAFKYAPQAQPQFFIFHFSFFIIHFNKVNKVVRYEDLNGWVGGKRRTRSARFRTARGNVFTIRKKERRRRESRPGKEIYMKIRNVRLDLFDVQTTAMPGLSAEMKTFYENTLIDMAEPKLVHDRFADKYPIPRNGGKTIELRKYSSLAKATTPLVEGVTPAGNMLSVTAKTATVNQYGDYIKLSDMLELTAIDNNVVQSTKLLGSQSGRTLQSDAPSPRGCCAKSPAACSTAKQKLSSESAAE